MPNSFGHQGNFAPDGKTFYATQNFRGVGGFLGPRLLPPGKSEALPPWQYEGDGSPTH